MLGKSYNTRNFLSKFQFLVKNYNFCFWSKWPILSKITTFAGKSLFSIKIAGLGKNSQLLQKVNDIHFKENKISRDKFAYG